MLRNIVTLAIFSGVCSASQALPTANFVPLSNDCSWAEAAKTVAPTRVMVAQRITRPEVVVYAKQAIERYSDMPSYGTPPVNAFEPFAPARMHRP